MIALPAAGQTLQLAERAFDAGNYSEAARLFQKAHEEGPGCEPLFGLGISQYRLHQAEAALVAFQSAVQCDPKMTIAYVAMGEAYAERKNDRQALALFLQALKLEPRNSSALRGAAAIYLREKTPQKGIEVLELLVEAEPRDAQARVDLSAEYLATGNAEGAEKQFQQALRLKPNDGPALLGLANTYLRNGDAEQAIALLQQVVRLAPNAYQPRFLLGSAYNRQGRYQESVDELQAALRLGAQDPEVYYHLARAYGSLGNTEDRARALGKFAELTKKSKEDLEALRQSAKLTDQASSLVSSGDLNGAAARLEQARELHPSDDALLFRLAGVHFDLRQYDKARGYAEEAISLAPAEWLYRYLLGLIETRVNRWQQAEVSLRFAAQLNPSAAEVHNALGQVALGEGDPERAAASFLRAAELDPKEAAYRSNLEAARRDITRKNAR